MFIDLFQTYLSSGLLLDCQTGICALIDARQKMARTVACASCDELQKRVEELTARCKSLESENAQLLRQLQASGRPPSATNRPGSASAGPGRAAATNVSTGSTVDTTTASGDTTHCTNCDRPIPSATFSMHTMHCARNIARCPQCNKAVPSKELTSHIAVEKGTPDQVKLAIETCHMAFLQSAIQHGADPMCSLSSATGDQWLHTAVRVLQVPVVDLLCNGAGGTQAGDARVDKPAGPSTLKLHSDVCKGSNNAGETPLHALCSYKLSGEGEERQRKATAILDIARSLLAAGASFQTRTVLGDTPLQMAQRNGLHDLALLLASAQQTAALRQPSRSEEGTGPVHLPLARPSTAGSRPGSASNRLAPLAPLARSNSSSSSIGNL